MSDHNTRSDGSGDAPVTVNVPVGDLYMVLAWADRGLRSATVPDDHEGRRIVDSVRESMDVACARSLLGGVPRPFLTPEELATIKTYLRPDRTLSDKSNEAIDAVLRAAYEQFTDDQEKPDV